MIDFIGALIAIILISLIALPIPLAIWMLYKASK
jgi:hypothetical protein